MSNIKILLFDAAGVLFEANKVVSEDIQATLGLTPEQQMPMWTGVYKQLSTGKVTLEEFFSQAAIDLKVDPSLVNMELLPVVLSKHSSQFLGWKSC